MRDDVNPLIKDLAKFPGPADYHYTSIDSETQHDTSEVNFAKEPTVHSSRMRQNSVTTFSMGHRTINGQFSKASRERQSFYDLPALKNPGPGDYKPET